ncbi:MAG: oxygen-independent coproporphyrinogen III oxidase [Proteobacteria bacterium]|nr:oxygen-independent coproporphyrinogen III oxidase [Pseudomonadota bacterium]
MNVIPLHPHIARADAPAFDAGLLARYDGPGPRYTSYPTADRFGPEFAADRYVEALSRLGGTVAPLSLYVHLPFCDSICYYCACNKVVTRDRTRSARYVEYLCREIAAVRRHMAGPGRVRQIHWGGGTPTFLTSAEQAQVMRALLDAFDLDPDAEVAIEVDPRKVDAAGIARLAELGFNRLSVGVQDFDHDVQVAVNRVQGEPETRAVIEAARHHGFDSVNVDLIYGLPRQTVASFARTLDRVADLAPDRIALYGYAHVPHLFKPQRSIAREELPDAATRLATLELAIARLAAAGYVYIGMDHFARRDDPLAVAQRAGRLRRNFQGYTADSADDLLAFGISAIGAPGDAYVQNVRTLGDYYAALDRSELPVLRGHALSADDRVRRAAIHALMCDFALDTAAFSARHGVDFERTFAPELAALATLAADGLVEVRPGAIRVTPRGRLLVRVVAKVFDRYLRDDAVAARYSKVI